MEETREVEAEIAAEEPPTTVADIPDVPDVPAPGAAPSGAIMETIERLAARQDQLEQDLAAALERESRFSRLDHAHPHDASTQSLIDALGEIDREEQSPVRKRWYERRLFGGD